MSELPHLSRREREIMDIIYAQRECSVTEVLEKIPEAPTRTAVRTLMRILEGKGHLKHKKKNREFIYCPTQPRKRVGQSAFQRILQTFFDGSLEKAVAAYLSDPTARLKEDELQRLVALIHEAKKKEKQ